MLAKILQSWSDKGKQLFCNQIHLSQQSILEAGRIFSVAYFDIQSEMFRFKSFLRDNYANEHEIFVLSPTCYHSNDALMSFISVKQSFWIFCEFVMRTFMCASLFTDITIRTLPSLKLFHFKKGKANSDIKKLKNNARDKQG